MIPNGYCDIGIAIKFGGIEILMWLMTHSWRQVIENKEGILLMDRMRWEPDGKEIEDWATELPDEAYCFERRGPIDKDGIGYRGHSWGWWDDPWGFKKCFEPESYVSISDWFGGQAKRKVGR
jgi:hypothetical protein